VALVIGHPDLKSSFHQAEIVKAAGVFTLGLNREVAEFGRRWKLAS